MGYLGLRRVVHNLPRLDRSPLVTLDPDGKCRQDRRNDEHLHTHFLAVVHLRLGGPVEELGDVLGHLGGSGGGAVLVVDNAVIEDTGHGDT
jgi:hypothetical protein